MLIGEAVAVGEEILLRAQVPDARHDARRLLAFVLRTDPMSLSLRVSEAIPAGLCGAYLEIVRRRADRVPLQYLEGEAVFMGFPFRVSPDVLIPRQDTETLCEEAIRIARPLESVLEIGTGSGALAVSIKRIRPDLRVTAVDISAEALGVARENAMKNHASVEFLQGDCYEPVAGRRFHIILSNPPYIPDKEMETLSPEVRMEPGLALRGGSDGLAFYRRLIKDAGNHLYEGGRILFEIGWKQKEAVSEMLRKEIGVPFAKRDDAGNWRVVGAAQERRSGYES